MNTRTKAIIKSGLFSGIVYAGLMAGFDYSDGQDFKIWKFIFHASFFGIFMALMTRYNLKKTSR
ncbi:hypothetical protein MC378_15255 [Polaribacter sp. MSW13]|uniref:Uncharacterized protein n=1 Tax=Polaribacter marinus TaxID=2916838 RepID=A0A9X2AKV9_9FLAO|nr:hypothetical protein [Polaribacter marinus]MCI2230532.1 hypothetical protein [Polaribacter marinus]